MKKRMSEADIETALRSMAASYEHNLTRARRSLIGQMDGIQVTVATMDRLIRAQELAAVWRPVLASLDNRMVTASAHLDHFRIKFQDSLVNWEPSQDASDIYRIEDKARAAAWRRFLQDTKGMI